MRVTSSEVMGSSTVEDDEEEERRGSWEEWMRTLMREEEEGSTERRGLIRPDVSPPTYTTNDSLRRPLLSDRHLGRSLHFRLAVHTFLFCASVMLFGGLLRLTVYKGGQVGYDMGGHFVYFTFGIHIVSHV